MQAGKLDKRLDIEQPISTQDASGSPVVSWLAVGTVWASIEPIKGREALTSNQIIGTMDARIRIRQHPLLSTMTPKWRLKYDGVIFNIVSIAHVSLGNREIEIMCLSGSNDG
jgi:SPP1 family predicted phage head-tail adaptor